MKVIQRIFNRIIFPLVIFSSLAISIFAQDINPIRWSLKSENQTVKAGATFNVQLTATIDAGWHLYSLEQPEGGPIPTRISVPGNQKFKLAGDIETPQPLVVFDPNFNLETQFYEQEAVFTVPLEIAKDATGKKHADG